MAKLERKAYVIFFDSTFGGQTPAWHKIGADLEEFSVELNPEIEKVPNILGETAVRDKGYEPSAAVDPFYANPSDGEFYEKIRDIALDRKTGDACKTKILEVLIEDTSDASHLAYTQDVILKPTAFGGGIEGVNIPFDVNFEGNRTKGTVVITEGTPVFTAAT